MITTLKVVGGDESASLLSGKTTSHLRARGADLALAFNKINRLDRAIRPVAVCDDEITGTENVRDISEYRPPALVCNPLRHRNDTVQGGALAL